MAKKVRVIKSNEPTRWYADYIGEVFEVIDEFGADYRVKHGDGVEFIEKADCNVFAEEKEERVTDAVSHPNHYTQGKFETIEVIEHIVEGYSDPFVSHCVGTATKYLDHAPYKHDDPLEDLRKARA